MFRRGQRTSVREAVNESASRLAAPQSGAEAQRSERELAESLLSLCGATLREGTVLIAQEGDELLGVAVLRLHAGDAEILALVTDPNHRHRGVGRQLVLEMVKRARVARCNLLRVRISRTDDGVLGFFRALGFEETHLALDLAL
jgi:ribosomal protein S18 acetylase RimI-like enzyme